MMKTKYSVVSLAEFSSLCSIGIPKKQNKGLQTRRVQSKIYFYLWSTLTIWYPSETYHLKLIQKLYCLALHIRAPDSFTLVDGNMSNWWGSKDPHHCELNFQFLFLLQFSPVFGSLAEECLNILPVWSRWRTRKWMRNTKGK